MVQRVTGLAPHRRVQKALVGYLIMISSAAGQTTTFDPAFQGIYFAENRDTSSFGCGPSATFDTWRSFAYCCPIGNPDCNFFTECVGNTLSLRYGGGTSVCPSDYPNCVTVTIFDKFPEATTKWREIGCGVTGYAVHSLYREIATSTSSASSTSSTTSSTPQPPTPASSASITEPSITSSAATTATATATADPQPSTPSQSKAWMAGTIVGAMAVLLLCGGLFAWWWRRKNQKEHARLEKDSLNVKSDDMTPSGSPTTMVQTRYEGDHMEEQGQMGNPLPELYTPHPLSPSTLYSSYYPPSTPSQYGPYPYHSVLSGPGTPSTMSGWQGHGLSPPPAVLELHSESSANAAMRYQNGSRVIAEIPTPDQRPMERQAKQDITVEAP